MFGSSTGNLLVVDDEEDVLGTFQAFLDRKGYRCSVASDALSAMRQVRKGNVDLVLTDYHMPDMNGLELLQEVKRFNPKLPARSVRLRTSSFWP